MTFERQPVRAEVPEVNEALDILARALAKTGRAPILLAYARPLGDNKGVELELTLHPETPRQHEYAILGDVRDIIMLRMKELQQ